MLVWVRRASCLMPRPYCFRKMAARRYFSSMLSASGEDLLNISLQRFVTVEAISLSV